MDAKRAQNLADEADALAADQPAHGVNPESWMYRVRALLDACTERGGQLRPTLRDQLPVGSLGPIQQTLDQLDRINAQGGYNPEIGATTTEPLRGLANSLRTVGASVAVKAPAAKAPREVVAATNRVPTGWQRLEALSQGGQGEVMLVAHLGPRSAKGVLKRLPAARLGDGAARKRLVREIAALNRLEHPCIVKVLGASTFDADPWIITEWAPLGSLHKHLAVFRNDVWRTLRVARDVALALKAVHAQGLVHRDVKPNNILLRDLDHAMLADLGIVHDPNAETMTGTNERVGPVWFAPPEYEGGRIEPTPAFDVYSLGKVIYTALAGGDRFTREDFESDDANLVVLLARRELQHVNKLLRLMIVAKSADRMQSMDDVVQAIDSTVYALFGARARGPDACSRCDEGIYKLIDTIGLRSQPAKRIEMYRFHSAQMRVCSRCSDIQWKHVGSKA